MKLIKGRTLEALLKQRVDPAADCGLTARRARELAEGSQARGFGSSPREVALVGDWVPRKGSDGPAILAQVRSVLPGTRFACLGTRCPPEQVGLGNR